MDEIEHGSQEPRSVEVFAFTDAIKDLKAGLDLQGAGQHVTLVDKDLKARFIDQRVSL